MLLLANLITPKKQPQLKTYTQAQNIYPVKPNKYNMKYKVHRFEIRMSRDQQALEDFLNHLPGEIISIIPNVQPHITLLGMGARVSFLYIVEKTVTG
jgi:hypothetical protein